MQRRPGHVGTVTRVSGSADEAKAGLELEADASAELTPRALFGFHAPSTQLTGFDWDSQMGPQTGVLRPRTGTCHGARHVARDAPGHQSSGSSFPVLVQLSPYPSEAVSPRGSAQLWPAPSREPISQSPGLSDCPV